MATRLYVVTPVSDKLPKAESRLIRAKAPAGALKFATNGFYDVDAASAEQVAALVGAGVKVEDATVVEAEPVTV